MARPRPALFREWRGSVVSVTNENGSSITGIAPSLYEAFGAADDGSTPSQNPGYNAHESTDGLVYMRNRWYDPNTGRFTQEDPIGFAGGVNLYAYVGNNPVLFADPFGLCPPKDHDVTDCDNDKLGDAWRALAATQEGRAVIADYASYQPDVNSGMGQCSGALACSDAQTGVTVMGQPGTMAVGLAHEIEHVKGGYTVRGTAAGAVEERSASERGMLVMNQLRGRGTPYFMQAYRDGTHGPQFDEYKQNRNDYLRGRWCLGYNHLPPACAR